MITFCMICAKQNIFLKLTSSFLSFLDVASRTFRMAPAARVMALLEMSARSTGSGDHTAPCWTPGRLPLLYLRVRPRSPPHLPWRLDQSGPAVHLLRWLIRAPLDWKFPEGGELIRPGPAMFLGLSRAWCTVCAQYLGTEETREAGEWTPRCQGGTVVSRG